MKLMEKTPAKRFASAKELLRELARIRESLASTQASGATPAAIGPATEALVLPGSGFSVPSQKAGPARPRGKPLTQRLAGIRPGRGLLTLACLAGLAGGGLLGWMARTPDLLADGAPGASGEPALWIEPRWRSVEKRPSPRDQLRHAQLVAKEPDRVAAFLAVPGHFPGQPGWALTAYTQLARHLLAQGDADRLRDLSGSLQGERSEPLRQLSALAAAGADALEDRAPQARDRLTAMTNIGYLAPPGLAEFALEVVERAVSSPSGASMSGDPWSNLRNDLLGAIGIESNERADPLEPPRRGGPRPDRP
jgi:hypothetical protein